MERKFAGKVVLVSGGATGVGAASVVRFAEEGAKVAIFDRNVAAGEELAKRLSESGHKVTFFHVDVSNAQMVREGMRACIEAFDRIDVLFNHAGTILIKPFLDIETEEWDDLFAVNVRSMFLVTKAALPHMIAGGGGAIVCTSSISATAATPTEVAYNATKGACHMFARAIAVEFRDRNIRCNAVCPGFIDTPHGQKEIAALKSYGVGASEEELTARQGRAATPQEIADAVVFLASDDARFINGTHLYVDNGFTAW
ncbi:SDR family NAD(P)-dependent oxidoreductase [Acetobacter estunensis]|uniref:SDR family NAD(P)-dependent oxidoreductase n=1 Tax=Acetobacter estunensis TaxID=104097 RepID=UPI001C2DA4CE|nr:SDR family NAD(P)-dependent oxidoreductase [Acetobacter estunensis]MBV1837057.1 SDR family oxidoreductase [Acetobacter estunensis]